MLSIAVQPRDSGFVKLGTKHRYNVVPESIVYSGDASEYGCLNATFLLKINPEYQHYDLEHFTPVVITDGKVEVWSGRIISTPTEYGDTGIIHVECQGWGQHLKDDATDYEWVISDLSRFYNTANGPASVVLSNYQAQEAQINGSTIVLPCPQGSTIVQNRGCCATIDLGKNVKAKRAIAKVKSVTQPGTANFSVYLRISSSPDTFAVAGTDAIQSDPPTTTSVLRNTATTAARYVHIFWFYGGPTTAAGADHSIQVESLKIFMDSADESGDDSVLLASSAIIETLDLLCPTFFSSNRTKISTTSFYLPQFPGKPGFKYGSELIEAANAYHGYKFLLSPNAIPIPIFEPQDSVHSFVVGAQDDYKFSDPSRNDGRSVFSRVISEFTGTDGIPDYSEAASTGATWARGNAAINDGGFEGSMTNWSFYTAGFAGLAANKSAVHFQSGIYGMAIPVNDILTGLISAAKVNKRYRVSFYAKSVAASDTIKFGSDGYPTPTGFLGDVNVAYKSFNIVSSGWTLCQMEFTNSAEFTRSPIQSTSIDFSVGGSTGVVYVDSFEVEEVMGNVVNRRGFQRTKLAPISSRSTSAYASGIAALELGNSNYPPLQGKLELAGTIRSANGDNVPVSRIPSAMGKIILLEQFKDPNTGAVGRKAPIKQAEYNEAENKVMIDLDDNNDFISNLKNRIL